MTQEDSAPIALLRLVRSNANTAISHSWERLNQGMRNALELAICLGFEFDLGDFDRLDQFRSDYWIGLTNEWCYTRAVAAGNMSAVKSYESHMNRVPLIADDVCYPPLRFVHAHNIHAKRSRLCVGSQFTWQGQSVRVTSIVDNEVDDKWTSVAIACSYVVDERGISKVDRRFTITRKAILADRKQRREAAK